MHQQYPMGPEHAMAMYMRLANNSDLYGLGAK